MHLIRPVICLLFLAVSTSAKLGPPKLVEQSPKDVWYQIDDPSPQLRPVLKCRAENADSYVWLKDGARLEISPSSGIEWQSEGHSGSLILSLNSSQQGVYQCLVSNIYGTALSDNIHLQLGFVEHFGPRPIRELSVFEGDSLTLSCDPPNGHPKPKIIWLYRDTQDKTMIETIRKRHIVEDETEKLHFLTTEVSDGREGLIYECAATSAVLLDEYRSGDQFHIKVLPKEGGSKTVSIKKLYTSPEQVTVRAGEILKLQCIFGAKPIPSVFWRRLDGTLPDDRMKDLNSRESDYGQSLVIEKISPADAGKYECSAGEFVHRVNVRVETAPFWENGPPRDVEEAEENTAELECLAGGSPFPIVKWSFNGRPLHETGENTRRILLDNGRVLRIQQLDHDVDTGVFQCNASNPLGYVYANAFVNVQAHAPRFLMPTERIWRVVLHSRVHLDCSVEAAPTPIVRWVDADDRPLQIVHGKTQLYANNTFEILDVNTADEGLYYCNVSNKYGLNRATNRILVYKPSYFVRVPTPRILSVEAGEIVRLQCEAVADTRLPITYKWTLNGVPILNNSHIFQISEHELVISKTRGRVSGIVDCVAITDVDVKLASMQLIVKDVPSTPKMISFECTERKAVLRWNASNEHSDPIRRYIVEMQTDFRIGHWEKVEEETDIKKLQYEADITLTPWVNYTFRVVAENSHGRSDSFGEPAEMGQCQTRPSFPYSNPHGVRAEGTQPDNLVIYWKPMDKYYWNAPNLQYLVRYRLNKEYSAWNEFLVEDPLENHTIIREQPTFKSYLVQVRAVNAIGPSIIEPNTVVGFSGEDLPSAAPTDFKIAQLANFSHINFTWTGVNASTVNGHFEGYIIEYKRDHDREPIRVFAPVGTTHKVITSMFAHYNYTVVVRTKNRRYMSKPSNEIRFATPEGVPSKVHDLRVYAVGSTSILLKWQPPLMTNGIIRGYFIAFHDDRNETEETYVIHKQTAYLHERSIPDTGYKVSVWGETGAGEGPKTTRVVRTWSDRNPDIPVFRVRNVTTSKMWAEWLPHTGGNWKMPGAAFYLNYSEHGKAEWNSSETIYLPETRIQVEGLKDDTQYDVFAVAKDGKRFSQSPPLTISTFSMGNSTLNQESLRSAAWFIAVLVAVGIALVTIIITCCCERRKGGRYPLRRKEVEFGHKVEMEEEKKFLEFYGS